MFTQNYNNEETGDIVSYAKWFNLQKVDISIFLLPDGRWTSTASNDEFKITSSACVGLMTAIHQIYTLTSAAIGKKNTIV